MSALNLSGLKAGDYVDLSHAAIEGTAPSLRYQQVRGGEHSQYVAVFGAGDEIMSGLHQLCEGIPFGFASFSGIGAGHSLKLAWYSLAKKAYRIIDVPEQVEILAMEGNIGLDEHGGPVVHSHLTVATETGKVIGGHLLQGFVDPTLEVVLDLSPARLVKRYSENVGLLLYDLEGAGSHSTTAG